MSDCQTLSRTWLLTVSVCACKDAMCLSMLTSQGCGSSLMLLLVLTEPASDSVPEPAQHFLSFFVVIGLFLEDTGCVKSGYGCGRVGVLLPSISILRQLATPSPCSHAQWKEVTEQDWKRFSQNFKDSLLCLRTAKRGCSFMSSCLAKAPHCSPLAVLVKTVFWLCLAVGQTLWSSSEWFTGQPGDGESAS